MTRELAVTQKQKAFIDAEESEVLFGGAAGGGKSYGQMVDALLFALKYPGSKQLALRRTFAELDKSLIRTSLEVYPKGIYTFNSIYVGNGKFLHASSPTSGGVIITSLSNSYYSSRFVGGRRMFD